MTYGSKPLFTKDNTGTVTGRITAAIPTALVKIVGVETFTVSPVAVADGGKLEENSCILTLGKSVSASSDALTFNGAPNISLDKCTLRSNASMRCNGHGGGSVASIAVGTVSGCSNPLANAVPVPDIYEKLASNITKTCAARPGFTWLATPGVVPAGLGATDKGTYNEYRICGDLTLTGSGYLTGSAPAKDSVIIVENGKLIVGDNANINTKRVTIVLTGNNSHSSEIVFPNGKGKAATLSVSPPTTAGNPWRGVSIYQDPALTSNVDHSWGPAATFNIDGVVYLPNADLTMSGSGASGVSGCTKLVVDTLRTNGSVNLSYKQSVSACSQLGVEQWADTEPYLTH